MIKYLLIAFVFFSCTTASRIITQSPSQPQQKTECPPNKIDTVIQVIPVPEVGISVEGFTSISRFGM
jgi:hypothetical protein